MRRQRSDRVDAGALPGPGVGEGDGVGPRFSDDARSVARGGASLLVLQTLGRVAGLAFVMLLTRHLDGANVGRYSTVAAIVVFANFLADFGTSPAITRMISRGTVEADRLLSRTVPASLLLGLLVGAGVVVFAHVAYSGPVVTDIVIGSLAIPAAAVLSSVLGALDGRGLIARRALITCLQTLVIALGVVPVVAGASVRAPIVALTAAPWIALLAAVAVARASGVWRTRPRFDSELVRQLLKVALPFAITGGVTAFVMRFDVILLSIIRPPDETASYDLALRLLEASTYVGTAIGSPLLFIISRRLGDGDRDGAARAYREAMRVLYAIGLPLSVGIVILAQPIVTLALGEEFRRVATPLAIMGAAQWVAFVIVMQGVLVMGGNAVRQGTLVAVGNAVVIVTLDVILVPRYGAWGAAAAMVVSWLVSAGTLDLFHRRTTGIATPLPNPALVASTMAMAAVLLVLRDASILVSAPAGAVTYAVAVVATRAVAIGDLSRIRQALAGTAAT